MNPACGPPARKLSVSFIGLGACACAAPANSAAANVTAINIVRCCMISSVDVRELRAAVRGRVGPSSFSLPGHQHALGVLDEIAEEDAYDRECNQHREDERHVEVAGAAQEQVTEAGVG